MCGIAGYFSSREDIQHSRLRPVLDVLHKRGPDHTGALLFDTLSQKKQPEKGNLALLHTRLSVIDLSEHAHQPLSNEDETVFLVFNGEIYNFKGLREELLQKGHRFRSQGDAEVIVHLYEEYGESFLSRLEGMFAFALYDKKKNTLLLARDRFGKKPLVFLQDTERFLFASTVRAITVFPDVPKEIDATALEHYFCYRYMPPPFTGLRHIQKLPPAHFLRYSLETKESNITAYWQPPANVTCSFTFQEAQEELQRLLRKSVEERLVADVPVGLLLSGGMDSGTLLALATEQVSASQEKIKTFTFGFEDKSFDESEPARQMAEHFGSEHTEIHATENIPDDIDDIVMAYDEPFADPSAIPSYYIAQEAAKHVKVVLGGDGGDELFGGYKRYHIHARNSFLTKIPPLLRKGASFFVSLIPFDMDKKSMMGGFRRFLMQGEGGYAYAFLMRVNNLDFLTRRHLLTSLQCSDAPEKAFEELYNKTGGRTPIEKVMNADCFSWLPGYILKKSDLSCMAHSLEGRHPFLSNELLDFALSLPKSYKLPHGGKYILKESMKGLIPENILKRKKMGFSPPLQLWLNHELKGRVEDVFFSEKSVLLQGDFFQREPLRQMVKRHYEGGANFSEQIWMLLSLALWMEGFRLSFSDSEITEGGV